MSVEVGDRLAVRRHLDRTGCTVGIKRISVREGELVVGRYRDDNTSPVLILMQWPDDVPNDRGQQMEKWERWNLPSRSRCRLSPWVVLIKKM